MKKIIVILGLIFLSGCVSLENFPEHVAGTYVRQPEEGTAGQDTTKKSADSPSPEPNKNITDPEAEQNPGHTHHHRPETEQHQQDITENTYISDDQTDSRSQDNKP